MLLLAARRGLINAEKCIVICTQGCLLTELVGLLTGSPAPLAGRQQAQCQGEARELAMMQVQLVAGMVIERDEGSGLGPRCLLKVWHWPAQP